MTEHTRIPLPGEPGSKDGSDQDETKRSNSLLERAVDHFKIAGLSAPPIPLDAISAASRKPRPSPPAAKKPADPATTEAPAAADPASATAPASEFDELVARPLFAGPAGPKATADTPQPEVARHQFDGVRHEVDRAWLRDNGLIVPEGSVTTLLEEFRIIKRQLLVQAADLKRQKMGSAAQRILICSPHPGEGKTFCSVNLALSIASERETEVLLVDADMAKPSILSTLGLPGGPGLMDALTDETIDPTELVIGTDIPGLWVLPAGDTTSADSEYLSSSRTGHVLDRLTHNAPHRIVIFDSPPVLAASPAAELARHVGQAVLVARADRTGQGALEDAISLLAACPNIQLLLNASQFSPSGRRFGSYYGYKA
ncbi:P-loop NTPase family protein [Novosphingobium aquimarinum]|uniref:capsular biosynthesis protein n=1 Tax=Novosphingobium aquimarinum TaxID=2682494 RepID=UPI0012EB2D96|nr:capsular biosynthesis protein [Novosphingobium aquimarinum]